MLETKIRDDLGYLGDLDYMAEIVTSPGAVDALIRLLQSNDNLSIGDACLFIRDFVLSCSRNDICKKAWESELESAIIPVLEHLLFADNHFTRQQVVYTLGKICSYDSVPVMLNAFYQLRDRDPILVPQLIIQLFELGIEDCLELIYSTAASDRYTTRWAIVAALDLFNYDSRNLEDPIFLMRYDFYQQMRHDLHPLVRAEAEYKYQFLELQRRKHRENLSKSKYNKQRKALKSLEISFVDVDDRFIENMLNHNLHTYTVEELEKFIDGECHFS